MWMGIKKWGSGKLHPTPTQRQGFRDWPDWRGGLWHAKARQEGRKEKRKEGKDGEELKDD